MERNREWAIDILECFEELLDEKGSDIPSDDRNGDDGEARLYGCEYFDLEDQVMDILNRFESAILKSLDK